MCRMEGAVTDKKDDEFEALQQMRKEEIKKLERDLKLMEAQHQAFEAEDLNKEKAKSPSGDFINDCRASVT
jgi:hypothetical protein